MVRALGLGEGRGWWRGPGQMTPFATTLNALAMLTILHTQVLKAEQRLAKAIAVKMSAMHGAVEPGDDSDARDGAALRIQCQVRRRAAEQRVEVGRVFRSTGNTQ